MIENKEKNTEFTFILPKEIPKKYLTQAAYQKKLDHITDYLPTKIRPVIYFTFGRRALFSNSWSSVCILLHGDHCVEVFVYFMPIVYKSTKLLKV